MLATWAVSSNENKFDAVLDGQIWMNLNKYYTKVLFGWKSPYIMNTTNIDLKLL